MPGQFPVNTWGTRDKEPLVEAFSLPLSHRPFCSISPSVLQPSRFPPLASLLPPISVSLIGCPNAPTHPEAGLTSISIYFLTSSFPGSSFAFLWAFLPGTRITGASDC